ncbi:hypothetical protein ACFL1E_00540 [Candidatus Omnitrophota bacterium]
MKLNSYSGQSVLEYTLILAIVIGALVLVLFKDMGGGKSFDKELKDTYKDQRDWLKNAPDNAGPVVFQ